MRLIVELFICLIVDMFNRLTVDVFICPEKLQILAPWAESKGDLFMALAVGYLDRF